MEGNGICPVCHREEPKHVPKDCRLLKALYLKLVNVAPAAHSPAQPPQSLILAPASPSPGGRVASSATPTASGSTGSAMAPSGLTAALAVTLEAADNFDSDNDFRWAGDESCMNYADYLKSNNSFAPYTPSFSSVADSSTSSSPPMALPMVSTSLAVEHSTSPTSIPLSFHVINLSRNLHCLILCVSQSSIRIKSSKHFAVANTGATDHMLPDKLAFISYKAIFNLQVWMGNNSFILVPGRRSAVVSINGQRVLVHNALHVPSLVVPLYSLQHTPLIQHGCSFYGAHEAGMLVCFPTFVLTVDMLSDWLLSYKPLGHCAPLDTLHYVQPWCPCTLYPSEIASPTPSSATATPKLVVIEEESEALVIGLMEATTTSPFISVRPQSVPIDLSTILSLLSSLAQLISLLLPPPTATSTTPPMTEPPPSTLPTTAPNPQPEPKPHWLLSTLSHDAVVKLMHHEGADLPSICPCDTANKSDTKTHWTSEELHQIMGCPKLWNYKHLILINRDSEWLDGGEFPPFLDSYTTIRKANSGGGGPLAQKKYKYLDGGFFSWDCYPI
jgi:hypothetical protein